MRMRPPKFWVLILFFWPSALLAEGFRDSTVTYFWVRALAEQDDPKLNRAVFSLAEDYERHFPFSPKNSEILQLEGKALLKANRPLEAFVCFLKQHTVYPDSNRNYQSEEALVRLTLTHKALRRRANLIATFTGDFFAGVPFKRRFIIFMDHLYFLNLREIDQIALREIHQFLDLGLPRDGLDGVLYEKARILQRNGQPQAALFAYASLLRGWPSSENVPLCYYHIGEILRQDLKNKALAQAVFRRFVRRFPNHYMAGLVHLQLADLEEKNGALKEAVRDYVAFLNRSREKPLRALGYYRLGRLFQKKFGDEQKAEIFYHKLYSLYPNKKEAKKVVQKLNRSVNK